MAAQQRLSETAPLSFQAPVLRARTTHRTFFGDQPDEIGTKDLTAATETVILDRHPVKETPHAVYRPAKQAIEAVVSSVGAVSVLLSCRVGTGSMDIQLPTALVPQSLRVFGQPVYVALGDVGGYRAPRVTERLVEPHEDEELSELEGWLASL